MAGRDLFADQPVEAVDKGRDLFVDQPIKTQEGRFAPEPFVRNQPTPGAGVNPIVGNIEALLSGFTIGLSDEIQSVIAAAVASPFVSDKTFGQLMVDARIAMREQSEQFREQEGALALIPELIGGAATGAIGLLRTSTLRGAAAVGAFEGGAAGAGFADKEDFFSVGTLIESAIGVGIGATAAPAITSAIGVISKALKPLFRKPGIKVFDDTGQFTDEAIEELNSMVTAGRATQDEINEIVSNQLAKDGILTAEQAQRFNLFQRRGVPALKADITQATDDFIEQQSALKRTGPVSERVAQQDARLAELAEEGIEAIRPAAQNLIETNASVFSVVDDVVATMDSAVTKAYQAAKQVARGQPRVTFENLLKAVNDNRGSEKISGGVISSLRGTLKNKGLFKKATTLDIDKRGPRLQEVKKLTVNEAEEIRQSLNALFDSVTPQGRRLIRVFKNALDEDVAKAVGEDIFADARQAKITFQKTIGRGARDKFDKTRGSFLEDIIDNKIPEEKILGKLLSGRDDDFVKMKRFLTKDAGEAGVKAWNDIRAQTLRNALDRATSTQAKREGGQAVFNVRLFKNELAKLRSSKKFKELFNTDEIKLIDDIIEIGNLRIPQANVQQGRGPTELAVGQLRREIFRKIPIIGESAEELVSAVSNLRTDRALLDFTRATEAVLK